MQVGHLKVLYSAVIDAIEGELNKEDLSDNHFIQLKTCKECMVNKPGEIYRHLYLQWWSQNKLSGIPKILCGVTRDSRITYMQAVDINDLPHAYVKDDGNFNESSVSVNLL